MRFYWRGQKLWSLSFETHPSIVHNIASCKPSTVSLSAHLNSILISQIVLSTTPIQQRNTNENFYSKNHVTIQFTFQTLTATYVIAILVMLHEINFMSCLRYRWRVYFKSVIFIASWWVSCCCATHMFLICFWFFICKKKMMIKI